MSCLMMLLFSMAAGGACAVTFRRRFEESVSCAFFVQILLMLVSGMLFKSLTAGICTGAALILAAWGTALVRRRAQGIPHVIADALGLTRDNCGGLVFIGLFLFVCLINTGKCFNRWDEFSHWGVFIKECLRTDALYCASPLKINHQDYVPAITLFEVLWSRLSGTYSEADAFRAIQLLQLSVLMPLVTAHTDEIREWASRWGTILVRLLLILGIPLLFDKVNFYHSLYTDGSVALILYACMWIAHETSPGAVKIFTLTAALSILLQSKMLAVVFLPMVVIYAAVTDKAVNKAGTRTLVLEIVFESGIPLALWAWYNRYAALYHPAGGGQNYAGHGVSSILRVLAHDGSIPFQASVEKLYLRSLFTRGVIWKLPYLWAILLVIVFLLFIVRKKERKEGRGQAAGLKLLALWCLIASLTYAAVMLYLYLTSFGEYEASILDNYERYMSSLLLAEVFFVPAAAFTQLLPAEEKKQGARLAAPLLIAFMIWGMACVVREGGQVRQMLPGRINGEEPAFAKEAAFLKEHVADDESLLMISRGDKGYYGTVMKYACWPIDALAVSPGDPAFDGDIWSVPWSEEDLAQRLEETDHLWIYHADEAFWERYASLLSVDGALCDGALCRVEKNASGFVFTRECVYTE